jgi:hypothetical protein
MYDHLVLIRSERRYRVGLTRPLPHSMVLAPMRRQLTIFLRVSLGCESETPGASREENMYHAIKLYAIQKSTELVREVRPLQEAKVVLV